MDTHTFRTYFIFQPITYCRRNSTVLIILMHIQPIQIPRLINIPKTYDQSIFSRNISKMLLKRSIPLPTVNLPRSPHIHLLLGVITYIHRVHRLIEQSHHLLNIR